MPAEKGEPREFNMRQVLPWTELFRAFSIALDPSKLLLATAAVVLMWFGWWLLSLIFVQENTFGQWPAEVERGQNPYVVLKDRPGSLFTADFWLGAEAKKGPADVPPADLPAAEPGLATAKPPLKPLPSAGDTPGQQPVHLEPFHKFIKPILGLFDTTPGRLEWWYLLLGLLMTVSVWAIFGGAITRIAAIQFARNEKIGMGEALRFAVSKFVHFASAPLIPFAVMAVIAIIMFIGGLLLLLPYVGDVLASLLWVLPLLGALAMAIALLGYIGWPLMYATISVEGSDNFTALSNSYIYVFSRPLHYLWYMTVAIVFGMVVTFFVVFFTSLTVYLSQWGVGLSPNYRDPEPLRALFIYAPSSYDWDRLLVVPPEKRGEIVTQHQFELYRQSIRKEMDFVPVCAAGIMGFWLHLIFLVMIAFAYSFFWSASTIIYFLLRKKVDDTEMDEVYMDEEDDLPLPPPTTMTPASPSPATLPMVDAPRPAPEPPKTEPPVPKATMPAGGDGSPPTN